jgi:hypothetical protein
MLSTPLPEIKVPPEEGPLRWWWWPGGWILFLWESGSGMYCEGPPGDTDWGGVVANHERANKQRAKSVLLVQGRIVLCGKRFLVKTRIADCTDGLLTWIVVKLM